ncbi:MAG: hypothetical protein IPI60_03165 [Saprospiraceae bacterium]|nr:hypothetical protein [Saprospiraceae bacterium]
MFTSQNCTPSNASIVVSSQTTAGLPQLSVALNGTNSGIVVEQVIVNDSWIAANIGASSSVTTIVCEAVAVFPQTSVAVKVLTMINSFAQFPSIVSLDSCTSAFPQLSVANAGAYVSAYHRMNAAGNHS